MNRKVKHILSLSATIVFVLATAGCIHEYPFLTGNGEEGEDPTLVQVSAAVELNLEMIPLEISSSGSRSMDGESHQRRFIIEVYREGALKPEKRLTVVVDSADNQQKYSLPVHMKLHAARYKLAIWSDHVRAGTDSDLFYHTADLHAVSCTEPYTGCTSLRDAFYGTAELDLTTYRDQWNTLIEVKVEMVRPLARYEIIATDVKKFLQKNRRNGRIVGTGYKITFSYGYYFPTGFNVLTGKPCDSSTGVRFVSSLEIPENGEEECLLGSDYIFVNGTESFVVANMEITDANGTVVSRYTGLEIPYKRGHLTTIYGKFLTSKMSSGVELDPDFGGDINIDLD